MLNALAGHTHAVDGLYRASREEDFTGRRSGLVWDSKNAELAVIPDPPAGDSGPVHYEGMYISAPVETPFDFHELMPSWSIRLNEKTQGYEVHLRVADASLKWSPWFYFGAAGKLSPRPANKRILKSGGWGEVQVDYLPLHKPARYFQYRVELESHGVKPVGANRLALRRFYLCYSNTSGDSELWNQHKSRTRRASSVTLPLSLEVPYRSQLDIKDKKLAQYICCPTCIAMVLESHGIRRTTMHVVREAHDREHDIYGIWPRAAQTASRYGLDAWVQRFRNQSDVKRVLAMGAPIMASIRFKHGELSNADYKSSAGHLLLVRGITVDGDYIVNDPYCRGPKGAEIVYEKNEFAKVWFEKGGVGIVICAPQNTPVKGR